MNIRKAAAERLLAVDALKTLTDSDIYRGGRMPRNEKLKPPFIVVWLLDKERIYDHDGYAGLTEGILQLNCFALDPDDADTMEAEAIKALESWPAESLGAIDSVELRSGTEDFEPNTGIHYVLLDFEVSYHEEVEK